MASSLQGAEDYVLHDTVDGSHIDQFTNRRSLDNDEHIHLASLAEKKRLWWRNSVINAFFISSWCVILASCSLSQAYTPFKWPGHLRR